jgi:hypothetical protein
MFLNWRHSLPLLPTEYIHFCCKQRRAWPMAGPSQWLKLTKEQPPHLHSYLYSYPARGTCTFILDCVMGR